MIYVTIRMCQDTSKEPAVEPSHGEAVAAEAAVVPPNMSCRERKRESTSNKSDISNPRCSMYGVFTYIYHKIAKCR